MQPDLPLQQQRPAVAAIIGKTAQLAILAADQQDRAARRVKGAIVAGVGHLFGAAQKKPVAQEQRLAFEGKHLG